MKKFFVLLLASIAFYACQTPYSGTLGPKDFNGWIESNDGDTVCIYNGFDSICYVTIRVVIEKVIEKVVKETHIEYVEVPKIVKVVEEKLVYVDRETPPTLDEVVAETVDALEVYYGEDNIGVYVPPADIEMDDEVVAPQVPPTFQLPGLEDEPEDVPKDTIIKDVPIDDLVKEIEDELSDDGAGTITDTTPKNDPPTPPAPTPPKDEPTDNTPVIVNPPTPPIVDTVPKTVNQPRTAPAGPNRETLPNGYTVEYEYETLPDGSLEVTATYTPPGFENNHRHIHDEASGEWKHGWVAMHDGKYIYDGHDEMNIDLFGFLSKRFGDETTRSLHVHSRNMDFPNDDSLVHKYRIEGSGNTVTIHYDHEGTAYTLHSHNDLGQRNHAFDARK